MLFFCNVFGAFFCGLFACFAIFFHFLHENLTNWPKLGVKIGCVPKNRPRWLGVLIFRNIVVFWNIDVVFLHHLGMMGEVTE